MIVRWRQPDPAIVVRWRGPDGSLAVSALGVPPRPLAALIGPPGLPGAAGPVGATGPQGPQGASGAAITGIATLNITAGGGAREWSETVAASGVLTSHRLLIGLAPADDSDENDPELLDVLAVAARAQAGALEVSASFAEPTSGPVKFNWSAF